MLKSLEVQTPVLETLGWTLLHSLWQGALIAFILFFALLLVKRSHVRYVLSCAALLLMVLFPVVTFGMLYDKPDVTVSFENQTLPTDAPLAINQNDQSIQTDAPQMVPFVGQPQGIAPTEPFWNVDWRQHFTFYLPHVVALWVLGVILLSLRLLLQWLYAERFKRRHTKHASADLQHLLRVLALRLCVSRPVQLLESSLVDAPTVIGFLKPVILLPTSALTGLTTGQLEALLAHELAHIRRHDYLVNILQSVIETLLFYHPAVWWVSGRVRIEREHCCDDVAVGVSGNSVLYAKALATLETLRSQPQLALAASDGKLIYRVRRVLGVSEQKQHPFGWVAGGLVVIAATTLLTVTSFPKSLAQENTNKEIYLTVVADVTVAKDSNDGSITLDGALDNKSFAILEEKTSVQKQAALLGFNDLAGLLDASKLELQLSSTNGTYAFTFQYALNPIFSYDEQKIPSVTADEIILSRSGTLEPWLTEAAKGVGEHYLELANENLPLNGVTGTLEDGTKYSILIVKNREGFAQNLATLEDKDLRQQLLEQAFTHGVIPYSEYQTLLKTLSMNEPGLEQDISFTSPLDNAEVVTNFGEEGNFVALRAPSTEAPVKAVADGVVLNASRLSWNDGYIVSIEHADSFITAYTNLQSRDLPEEGQIVKQGDVIGYLGGGSILANDVLKLYLKSADGEFLDPLQFFSIQTSEKSSVITNEARQDLKKRVETLEEDLFTLSNSAHTPVTENILPDETTREVPFNFNPAKLGISELLERSYSLRLIVRDERGTRQVLDEVILPWASFGASIVVDGEATFELFINDALFMKWDE